MPSVFLFISLSIFIYVCLSVSLNIYLSVYVSMCRRNPPSKHLEERASYTTNRSFLFRYPLVESKVVIWYTLHATCDSQLP